MLDPRAACRHHPLAFAALIACAPALHAQAQRRPPTAAAGRGGRHLAAARCRRAAGTRCRRTCRRPTTARLRQLQSLNLPEFMASQLGSVNINETQGNPFQMDVNYRGFTASPLLGTPQGLSVYLDGVRINEPFGDVVNWDMIPSAALASITLCPGSNPLFGLNTLGGALVLQTKSGDTHPGAELELRGGSFGRLQHRAQPRPPARRARPPVRRARQLRRGRLARPFAVARAAAVRQGRRSARPTSRGTWACCTARSRLIGNGLLPEDMLAQRRAQVYTRPDQTDNRVTMLTLNATRQLAGGIELAGTAYVRRVRAATVNGDLNDDYDPPDTPESGVENRTRTRERSAGLALQLSKTAARIGSASAPASTARATTSSRSRPRACSTRPARSSSPTTPRSTR